MGNKSDVGTLINPSDGSWSRRIMQSIPPTYTVWKDGSNYIAEANNSGGVDYNDTDAATVIQNAVNATATASWQDAAHVHVKGTCTLQDAIAITNRRNLWISFDTLEIDATANKSAFIIDNPYVNHGVRISGRVIIQNFTNTSQPAIYLKGTACEIDVGHIYAANDGDVGVKIIGDTTDSAAYYNDVHVGYIIGYIYGVHLYANGAGRVVANNNVKVNVIYKAGAFVGVLLEDAGGGICTNNHIQETLVQADGATDGQKGFCHNSGYYNTLQNCVVSDLNANSYSIHNVNAAGRLMVFGGQYDHSKLTGAGSYEFFGVEGVTGRFSNFGAASIVNPNTSIVVSHGLCHNPVAITVTPTSETHFWVDTVTATEFTINVPVGGNYLFYWRAEYTG